MRKAVAGFIQKISGAIPGKNSEIQIASPDIGRSERNAVVRVMKSGNLSQGPEVKRFEEEFSRFVNEQECVAVNSGTSALHLALLSLGIGPGDEVLVPSFTFAASANAISLTGAEPKFVDVCEKTFCIDPDAIVKLINHRTRAILVVHLYGLPADMIAISEIATRHKLIVIEDAAQAHLASINQKPVGTFGDAAAFSFYPTKNMTSGEGGMVVFKDPSHARTARLLRNQGMEKKYENELVGFNLRMTDIHAAIGLVQIKKLKSNTLKRQENARCLSERLGSVVETPIIPDGYSHVFHQYTIRVRNNRDQVQSELKSAGIVTGVYYPTPVHKLVPFSSPDELMVTSKICKEVLSLPVHQSLTTSDLRRVAENVKQTVAKLVT